ncbi:MAG TPA: response regulator, partial [Polyangiaceae bacterium]|nr:response regulator [Polyangiaceae bacterium]
MSTPHVLIVEGHVPTRSLMRVTLQAEGYGVMEAESGRRALDVVETGAPALVFLDCKLPDMDGLEVGRQLGLLAPGMPLIALTGWASADESRLLAAGFLDVLVKPIQTARLVELVERYLGEPPPGPFRSGKRVLLVDDDPVQRKLAQLALSGAGFAVSVAEDGATALRLAAQEPPDVIVSDVLMPQMDGFAFCKAVRTHEALAGVPVVLMSAHYLEDDDRKLAARFGANRYVSRTDGFGTVVRAVLAAINSPVGELHSPPAEDLQAEYLRRVAHQLERQASIGMGLARRVSLQASALSVIDGLSDSLARQLDPESALDETLAHCLEAAGISMGAILLYGDDAKLSLKAQAGPELELAWEKHASLLQEVRHGGALVLPSAEGGGAGEKLLLALGATSAVAVPISARSEVLGTLLLASTGTNLAGAEGESAVRAARAISTQLGQALALSRMFSKLSSAEQRYRALFENARDAIAVLSPAGVILEANRGWELLLRLPRALLLGRNISDFAPLTSQNSRRSEYAQSIADGGGPAAALPLQREDGSVIEVEISRTVVEIAGEPSVLIIGRDVSERLQLEGQLRQSQKMEAIGMLAGGIAHDFNNVLSVILSYSETLLGGLKAGAPMREEIEEIHQAGKRSADLTRQLLMFSRQQVLAPKVLDLNCVLVRMERMLQRILGADVALSSLRTPQLGRVRIDPGSMEQVIMNLAVNARDAMPKGGKLTLETANVYLDARHAAQHHGATQGAHVMLAVTDSGGGIDPATQPRIFEPFYTTKGVGAGTGLGLSTVLGIVQQSGGHITLDTQLGRGTTFKVYLPRVEAESDLPPALSEAASPVGSETILL